MEVEGTQEQDISEEEQMAIYNTAVTVIANLEADTPEAAMAKLRESLERCGYDTYDSPGESPHAFEAEEGTEVTRRLPFPLNYQKSTARGNPYW